ncbi:hypothetical protein GX51_00086 [Blastomyces parvus]|uniref:Uncharacterized protein n=1 Tax=Blastomyces parvus TaxID=2060905 RepID=A0A2B7XMY2_9EURO|nr:hypothetical protein GX51_00086 [Blastomyces parvus]
MNGHSEASSTGGQVEGLSPIQNGTNGLNRAMGEKDFPIAICGMALRLPGGLATPQDFWEFLLAKGDARGRVPKSRYNVSAYYSETGKAGSVISQYGYFLDDSVNIGSLDASRFSMSRAELESSDPQQRLMLEVVREALDDAGEVSFKGSLTGCYMGTYGEDWLELQSRDNQQTGVYRVDGYNDFMLSSRISYEMDFRGPSLNIRTACSAAMIGFHEACLAMQRGDCNAAVVGGANLIMSPSMTQFMSEKGVLSPDGSCKTFSADANGYARGEAVTAIYIKPLDAAIRDGNPIRAVVRSTASNHDGKTPGMMQPSTESQTTMIRRAYEKAGISDFAQTGYVECHGTGTPVGDPIETNAVARVFGEKGVYIGSVKANLGHSEGASGLTSLIKAVLSLENRTIPPQIKFTSPNPKIPFAEAKLTVPLEPTPWPEDRYERASVNSFGIGGSNAHVILDSARSFNLGVPKSKKSHGLETNKSHLLLFSANSANSLTNMAKNFQDWTSAHSESLEDVAYTLAHHRERLPHRSFAVASTDRPAGTTSQGRKAPSTTPNLVMVFTGQGAQWPRMGRGLLKREDFCFKSTIRALDKYLQAAPGAPSWSLEVELLKPVRTSNVQTAELAQPLCTAVQIGLVDLFASLGVRPKAVVGHSSGEIAAAYAAGALSAKEAIINAWQRGFHAAKQTKPGAMAAIGLSWDEVSSFLVAPNVVVACENAPKSITLSGDSTEVQTAVARIKEAYPDITARLLKVDKAYHSYHMLEVGRDYGATLGRDFSGKSPCTPFYSSVTGTGRHEEIILGAKYWQRNLESPVLFKSAVNGILDNVEDVAFLEIGPHAALAGPVRQITAQKNISAPYVGSMTRGEDTVESFLNAVGTLFELGIHVNFEKLMPTGTCLPDLPRYPWDHKSNYWKESRMAYEWRNREFPAHPLLGIRQLESTSLEPSFRNRLIIGDTPWLRDHQIEEKPVFPCAGYVSMIGEGIRQLVGYQASFTLRNVILSNALLLSEDTHTELVTTFRPVRLTDSLDSRWWEFVIASHNGNTWQKHFTGEVTTDKAELSPTSPEIPSLPRSLNQRKYYDAFARVGMGYGPYFQLLDSITTGTVETMVAGKILRSTAGDENHYLMHPTRIDAALQSGPVAAIKGRIEDKLFRRVPTKIETLTVHRCDADTNLQLVTSSAVINGSGDVVSKIQCSAGGKVALDIENITFAVLQEVEAMEGDKPLITARLAWGPHIDFLDIKGLIKPEFPRELYAPALDELGRLCTIFSQRRISGATIEVSHMKKFMGWMEREVQCYDASLSITGLDDATLQGKIDAIAQRLAGSPVEPLVTALLKVQNNIEGLLSGEVDALELLRADNTLTDLYVVMDSVDRSQFIRHLAHTKPNLRILEIGAGTGASTAGLLKDLLDSNGSPLFSNYTFTDISSGFFVAAKERFNGVQNFHYQTLDIGRDPKEQGFDEDGKYDLVLATNVLHATKSLNETLINVRQLLRPDGRLLLQELDSSSKWVNYIFGLLPGWWLGEEDNRPNEPYVKPARWVAELARAGFGKLDAVCQDANEPFQLNSIFVARPVANKEADKNNKPVSLLCDGNKNGVDVFSRVLEANGYSVQPFQLGQEFPEGQDIISLLDIATPFFKDIEEPRFKAFQGLMDRLGQSGLLWVTKASQMQCHDPNYAQVIGAARTIRNEMLLDFATCEVDDLDSSLEKVVDVFAKFQARIDEHSLKPDYEYVISKGVVNVSRLYPISLEDELLSDVISESPVALGMSQVGRLNTLQWGLREESKLQKDDVEVEVHAAGLNFKDVLCAAAVLEYPEDGLGVEAAGIVTAVGPDVKDLRIGDRVMLLQNGSFRSHVVAPEKLCAKIPGSLIFEDAATMPAVFGTAVYSLLHLGGLQRHQSVLIHSACGGVGLAAIQIARMVDAEIYATVGSEEKAQYLMDTFGLPAQRIFRSRDTSFVEGVLRETNGKGVDLALNSLSGELLHATWSCIAEFGKVLDIGKRDFVGSAKLNMDGFLGMRTYASFDLVALMVKKQSVVKELLQEIVRYYQYGHIAPITPKKAFDACVIRDAFRYMQQGQHLGKIVISMRNASGDLKIDMAPVKASKTLTLDPQASYLLVGGLGGLGRSVARHLVEHGVRHLVFLSRSAGSRPDDLAHIKEIESMGCKVVLVKGSVANKDDVERAVSESDNLKGIFQCSMVLRDENFSRMSIDEWVTAVKPKVDGTWNLHNATIAAEVELDFFVMFSSMSGLFGQAGQANYAGANTFLDAFVQYRQSLGLAASALDIGTVQDIGYISRNNALLNRLTSSGAHAITAPELMQAVTAAAIFSSGTGDTSHDTLNKPFVDKKVFTIGMSTSNSLSSSESRFPWRKDRRTAIYHNLTHGVTASSGGSNDNLKVFLAKAKTNAAVLKEEKAAVTFAQEIGKKLNEFLLKSDDELNTSIPLARLGLDSLVAVEMRSWWRQVFNFDISVLELLGMGNLNTLGQHAAKELLKKLEDEA